MIKYLFIDWFKLWHIEATPKTIMRVMGVKGLTLYHLKSHLQVWIQIFHALPSLALALALAFLFGLLPEALLWPSQCRVCFLFCSFDFLFSFFFLILFITLILILLAEFLEIQAWKATSQGIQWSLFKRW